MDELGLVLVRAMTSAVDVVEAAGAAGECPTSTFPAGEIVVMGFGDSLAQLG
jgi:hypothetical protein